MAYREFPLADFEGGCRCMLCDRIIPDATPYAWRPSFVDDAENIFGEIVCVYCEFVEVDDGTA